jgi:hypothetical protein
VRALMPAGLLDQLGFEGGGLRLDFSGALLERLGLVVLALGEHVPAAVAQILGVILKLGGDCAHVLREVVELADLLELLRIDSDPPGRALIRLKGLRRVAGSARRGGEQQTGRGDVAQKVAGGSDHCCTCGTTGAGGPPASQ